jgi:hypothetical protein
LAGLHLCDAPEDGQRHFGHRQRRRCTGPRSSICDSPGRHGGGRWCRSGSAVDVSTENIEIIRQAWRWRQAEARDTRRGCRHRGGGKTGSRSSLD